jgi:hypothetical protein
LIRWVVAATAVALLAPVTAAAAPCPASVKPTLSVSDQSTGSTLYATHVLTVRGSVPGDTGAAATITAPGATRLESSEGDGSFVRNSPGPLTITGSFDTSAPGTGDPCTATVAATAQLLPAAPLAGRWRVPRVVTRVRGVPLVAHDPRFRLRLLPGKTSSLLPLTVRVRTVRRARLPGGRTKAVTGVYPLRPFETAVVPPRKRGCSGGVLVCSPFRNGFRRGVEVTVDDRNVGLGITVLVPRGVRRLGRRGTVFRHTPFGVVVEVLQGGARIARLRVAGKCRGLDQASRCRFRPLSTRP